jgi:FkbM family methyltransferase
MDIKQQLHRILQQSGWEVRRLQNTTTEFQAVRDVLRETRIDIVLDVGANIGQYGDLVLDTGFCGKLISFEAIPSVHARLAQHANRRSESWIVAPCCALGSVRGEAIINLAGNTVSSSLLPMRQEHVDALPQSAYVASQAVPVERLDEFAPKLLPPDGQLMLKVDTQGYELEVLRGATGLLPRTSALQVELSLVPLYQGAPTAVEAITFLDSLGFEVFSIVPGFKDRRSGRLLQADGIFVRRATSIPAPRGDCR